MKEQEKEREKERGQDPQPQRGYPSPDVAVQPRKNPQDIFPRLLAFCTSADFRELELKSAGIFWNPDVSGRMFERKPPNFASFDNFSPRAAPTETWNKEKTAMLAVLRKNSSAVQLAPSPLGLSTVDLMWLVMEILALLPRENPLNQMVLENFTTSSALFTKMVEVKMESGKGGREFSSMFLPKLFSEVLERGSGDKLVTIISKSPGFLSACFLPFLEDRRDGPISKLLIDMAEHDVKKVLVDHFVGLCSEAVASPTLGFARSSFVVCVLLTYFEKAGVSGTDAGSNNDGSGVLEFNLSVQVLVDVSLLLRLVPLLSEWTRKTSAIILALGRIDDDKGAPGTSGSNNSSSSSSSNTSGGNVDEVALFEIWTMIFSRSEPLAQIGETFPELRDVIREYFKALLGFFEVLVRWNVKRDDRVTWAKKFLAIENRVQNFGVLIARTPFVVGNLREWASHDSRSRSKESEMVKDLCCLFKLE